MTVFINPGSGPVAEASKEHAEANIAQFVEDLDGPASVAPVAVADCGDGRWRFTIIAGGRTHEIDMPGLPLQQVRWLDENSGNIWNFPRLYVDGSSWIWAFALGAATSTEDDA